MRQTLRALLMFVFTATCLAQVAVTRIEPPNWWAGMRWSTVQVMVTGAHLDGVSVRSSSPLLKVLRVRNALSHSYAFIDLRVAPSIPPGNYRLTLSKKGSSAAAAFPILKRKPASGRYQGFGPADVLYLVTPDRFANGDPSNDSVAGMIDTPRPGQLIGRHGGDIAGLRQHLGYIHDLGVTGVWINPLIENNDEVSYHGYAATDLYLIDRRFGTNEDYRQLVEEAHALGLKIILDHVSNHISIHHPWLNDLPSPDWLNGSVEHHMETRHWKLSTPDIHSFEATRTNVTDGWFNGYMPDLNQRNPLLAAYLIQNTLWWIEYTGLDGIREDTYPYADPVFLSKWARAIRTEYPAFNIVGEVWINDPAFIAPYQSGSILSKGFDTNLPSVTDFGLFEAFMKVFGDERADISAIYTMIAKDFLYPHPEKLVTFLDNHDVARIMYVCHDEIDRCKLALTLLLTLRGIPVIYYGTEIDMVGGTDHGEIRGDFPGGFPGQTRSAFTSAGRTREENDLYDFLHTLISIRKEQPALSGGTMLHFPSKDNIYVYLRIAGDDTVLVAANNNATEQKLDLTSLSSLFKSPGKLRDLLSGMTVDRAISLSLKPNSASIYSLTR